MGIKEIILTHPIAHLRLSIRCVDEVPRAGVHLCQRDDCVCRLATQRAASLLWCSVPERGEIFRTAPLPEVLPILTTALCLVIVEK